MTPGRRPTTATAKDLERLSRTMIAASARHWLTTMPFPATKTRLARVRCDISVEARYTMS